MEIIKSKPYQTIQAFLTQISKENDGGTGMYSDPITILLEHSEHHAGLFNGEKDVEKVFHNKSGGGDFVFYKPETKKQPEFRFHGKTFPLSPDVANSIVQLYTEQMTAYYAAIAKEK
ncbi:MAG: hypothetical protein FWC61_02265 [Proteobacteria bacterium]|nr:hypothetical protein [Pseudomonadota bacterium]